MLPHVPGASVEAYSPKLSRPSPFGGATGNTLRETPSRVRYNISEGVTKRTLEQLSAPINCEGKGNAVRFTCRSSEFRRTPALAVVVVKLAGAEQVYFRFSRSRVRHDVCHLPQLD